MKLTIFSLIVLAGVAFGASSPPYSLTVDFSARYSPAIEVYQANERVFNVRVVNAGNLSITNLSPVMWWAVSTNASQIVTGAVTVVNASNGTFQAVFSPSQLNTNGTFIYGVSVNGTGPTTARIGQFAIRRDPWATGAGSISYSTPVNWLLYQYLNTAASGPYRAGSGLTTSTNADGSVTFAVTGGGGGGASYADATNIVNALAYPLASNPSNYCTLAAAAGLTNGLSGTNHLHAGVYQPAGVYLVPGDTNRFVDASITNGLGGGSYTETDPVWAAASGSVVYANFQSLQSGNAGGPVGWNSIGVGQNVSADNLAAVFGQSSYAGLVGFAAGQEAIGGPGSFVYSTFLQDEPFNRTAHTNEFAVRAAGGAYFEVPTLQVSGTVSAVSFSGSGAALTGVLKPADTNGYVKAGITNGVWAKGDSVTNADLTTSTGLLPDGSLGTNSTRTVSNLTVKAGATVGTLNGLTPSTILTNIPAVITPVTLTLDAGNTATVQNVFYNDLGVLETNVTIVIGPTMTNTAQARSFWLDWSNTTYSITFPVGSFSNITANTATTNKAWSSYWHAGKGQTIFTGGWR